MNIETKFNVGDIAALLFNTKGHSEFVAMQIMEIAAQVCYTTTQVFYLCRPIITHKKFKHPYSDNLEYRKDFEWIVNRGNASKDDMQLGWAKFREDELIPATQEQIDIIKGVNIENDPS